MLFGLTSWKDYEDKVSWGVIVLYAGCISLGIVFKNTGASSWFADQIMNLSSSSGSRLWDRVSYINVYYWSSPYQFNECGSNSCGYWTSGT